MSAPNTRLPKQKRRHKGPLLGISLGLIVVVLLVFWFAGQSDDPDNGLVGNQSPEAVSVEPAAPDTEAPPE